MSRYLVELDLSRIEVHRAIKSEYTGGHLPQD